MKEFELLRKNFSETGNFGAPFGTKQPHFARLAAGAFTPLGSNALAIKPGSIGTHRNAFH